MTPHAGPICALIAGPNHHACLPKSHGEEPSCCQEGHTEKQAGTPPLHSDAVHGNCEYTRIEFQQVQRTASDSSPLTPLEVPCCRHTFACGDSRESQV